MHDVKLLIKLFLLLFLLIITYIYIHEYKVEGDVSAVAEQVVSVTSVHVADVRAVALKNKHGAFGLLAGEGGKITLEPNPKGVRYSLEEMQGFIYLVSRISSVRVIDKIVNGDEFGFADPKATLTIIEADGSKSRLLLGSRSGEDGKHYLRKENGEKIYVISAEISDLLLRSKKDFAEREIIPRFGVEDIDRFSSLSVSAKNRKERAYSVENKGGYQFDLQNPIVNSLSTERFFSDMILPLTSLYPQRIAEISAGVFTADPDYTLELVIDGKKIELSFVHKDDNTYYVKSSIAADVYEIAAERIGFLAMDYLELLSGAIYNCNVSRMDSVTFDDLNAGSNNTLYISGSGDKVQGEIDGSIIVYQKLMEFINKLNAIPMAEEVQNVEISETPYYTITINKKDGSRDYLEFINAGQNKSYLKVNGVVNFKVFGNVPQDIAVSLGQLIAGEGVEE